MPERILLINLQGIGNNLLMTPMLKLLRRHKPQARIELLVYSPLIAKLWEGCPYLDEVVALTGQPFSLLKVIGRLWSLRKNDFDISVTVFPANNYKFNLIAWLIGARQKISHKYPTLGWRSLSFLQDRRVPLDLSCHDIWQNIRLLAALGIEAEGEKPRLELWLHEGDYQRAEQFLQQAGMRGKTLVGIHPGSSVPQAMGQKRWPIDKFARLALRIGQEYKMGVLAFGGEEEAVLKERVVKALPPGQGAVVPALPLKETTALIAACSLFVSNDSGLMHLAALMQVPTVAIFGPTDERRTAPWGQQHRVVTKDMHCRPCWPLEEVGKRKSCLYPSRNCLADLSVEEVFQAVAGLAASLSLVQRGQGMRE